MCIAVYKPVGQEIPNKKTFKNCFDNNSHGAGFMLAINGKVHIEKGFMSFSAFRKGLKECLKKYHIKDNGKSLPMAFHFRITSQGAVCKELTHPYPLSNDYEVMKQQVGDYDCGIIHNGIIDLTTNYKVTDHNDTMEFIKVIMYPIIKNNSKYYEDKSILEMFEYLLSGNRVCILDKNGHAELLGNWIEDGGIYYSNSSYKTSWLTYKNWSSYSYKSKPIEHVVTVDELFDKPEEDNGFKKAQEMYQPLSDKQVSDLYTKGRLMCSKCGEDLILEYDDYTDSYIAYCPECGEIFYLDDNDASFAISQDIGYDDNQYYGGYDYGYDYSK